MSSFSLPRGETGFPVDVDTYDDSVGLVYMIPIARIIGGQLSSTTRIVDLEGIVVRPTNVEKGQCSRVGSFSMYNFHDKDVYEEFSQAILDVRIGKQTARNVCAEVIKSPEETFVFNIV